MPRWLLLLCAYGAGLFAVHLGGDWLATGPPAAMADVRAPDSRAIAAIPSYQGPLPVFARKDHNVEALYRWAATHQDALKNIPCTCGCPKAGHTSNWSCYVKAETSPGRYVWDPMSAG